MRRFLKIQEGFYPEAKKLRAVFDRRFHNPKEARADRFVWDNWYVPGQYSFLRTPAYHYFPKNLYKRFERFLLNWGQRTLGCRAISPPWLSYYVDGCFQELHSDVPHGPWAYVFSLTTGNFFRGGETRILRPETLHYWENFRDAKDRERDSIEARIASPFNRLTVFDPRLPHGVSEVRGTRDPREARLVVHGWFTEPRPYCEGRLAARTVESALNEGMASIDALTADYGRMHGCASLRLNVKPNGRVGSVSLLTNSIVLLDAPGDDRTAIHFGAKLQKFFSRLKFPKAKGNTLVTVPLLIR